MDIKRYETMTSEELASIPDEEKEGLSFALEAELLRVCEAATEQGIPAEDIIQLLIESMDIGTSYGAIAQIEQLLGEQD